MWTRLVALVIFAPACGGLYEYVPVAVAVPQAAIATHVDEDQVDADPSALTAFASDLDGFGTWSDDAQWGTIWTPNDVAFIPYVSDGHWASLGDNDVGEAADAVWLANTGWGAVTCHHGRWFAKPDVSGKKRWHWVPGLRYAPSWVVWKHDDGRLAMAPTPPSIIWRHGIPQRITPPSVEASEVVVSRAPAELASETIHPDDARVQSEELRRIDVDHHVLESRDAFARVDRADSFAAMREPRARFGGSTFSGGWPHGERSAFDAFARSPGFESRGSTFERSTFEHPSFDHPSFERASHFEHASNFEHASFEHASSFGHVGNFGHVSSSFGGGGHVSSGGASHASFGGGGGHGGRR